MVPRQGKGGGSWALLPRNAGNHGSEIWASFGLVFEVHCGWCESKSGSRRQMGASGTGDAGRCGGHSHYST